MLQLIDRLAGWWLNWRLDREVATNPELEEFKLRRVEIEDGCLNIAATAPFVVGLADEAARLLKGYNAQNYLEFDMLPRIDRGLRPIRITVQWAEGESPAMKAARFKAELEKLGVSPDYLQSNIRDECTCGHPLGGHRWPGKDCLQYPCDCRAFISKGND
jgi:hypothetical protein